MILPRAARAFAEIELEIRVAARRLDDLRERLRGERRAPEVRVHDHAGRVQHAPEATAPRAAPSSSRTRAREIAGIGAGADLLARPVEHRRAPRRPRADRRRRARARRPREDRAAPRRKGYSRERELLERSAL